MRLLIAVEFCQPSPQDLDIVRFLPSHATTLEPFAHHQPAAALHLPTSDRKILLSVLIIAHSIGVVTEVVDMLPARIRGGKLMDIELHLRKHL